MSNDRDLLESIDDKLETLVRLEVEEKLDQYDTKTEKVKMLHQAGFDTGDIADMVGSSPGSVRKMKSELKDRGDIDD